MTDYDMLTEEERMEYEREYNEWLDIIDQNSVDEDFELPEIDDLNSEEDDLFESLDESYTDEDEVIGYDDLIDTYEEYRELDFND
jgi:hypothetical protein